MQEGPLICSPLERPRLSSISRVCSEARAGSHLCDGCPLQAVGAAASNAVNMQLSARTLALRAAQVR